MSTFLNTVKKSVRPRGYIIAASIISIGGFLNGYGSNAHIRPNKLTLIVGSYDTGAIGAVTTMPDFEMTFGILTPALRGFTVSFLMLMGAVPSFFSGQLADRFGHLHVVMAGASVFSIGAILESASPKLSMFLVGRALCGIGEGLWLTNVSV